MSEIRISIYILIPFIWGLFSIFAYIISFQVSDLFWETDKFSIIHYSAGSLIFCVSFFVGFFILKFVLKPTEELLSKLKQESERTGFNQDIEDSDFERLKNKSRVKFFSDELGEFRKVFSRISDGSDIKTLQEQFPDIIFKSREMAFVLRQVLKVAPADAGVLILGESGTGKELIADAVHGKSMRKDRPFIKINCGAISPNLLESELFGHEKGAFTGAVTARKGCFERSDGGSLFLDEIGEMPLDVQVKLLRVLQNGEYQRVGGQTTHRADVRIISASNKNLEEMVDQGRFREDLFYRLNVFNINMPPLNERSGDLELLAAYFAENSGKHVSETTLAFLKSHVWKGNIRELENRIKKAGICSDNNFLEKKDFDLSGDTDKKKLSLKSGTRVLLPDKDNFDLNEELNRIEIYFIVNALNKNNGVQTRAAESLGIKPRSLWNRIKKYGINVGEFK